MFSSHYQRAGLLVAASSLAACGGGGSGGGSAIEGLVPPGQLTVVTPLEDAAPPGGSVGNVAPGSTSNFPSDADYFEDTVSKDVYDPALGPLALINQILCYVSQTGAGELVNAGPYNAQIDVARCEDGEDDGTTGGQSSGGANTADYEIWVVDSMRPDNSSPHAVHIWAPGEDPGEEVQVEVELSLSADTVNPFGRFHMDFAGIDTGSPAANPYFFGTLGTLDSTTTEVGFDLFEAFGDVDAPQLAGEFADRARVAVQMNQDLTAGVANISHETRYNFGAGDSGLIANTFEVAFDETHFLRATDGGPGVVYARGDFSENVWRYNLYHADGPLAGERVELSSGFGFRTETGEYGWIGYYGLWIEDKDSVSPGDTIFRDVFNEPSEEVPYTVFEAPGRLIRHERNELALTELEGIQFDWWTSDPMSGDPAHYQVEYFTDVMTWNKTGEFDDDANVFTPFDPPIVLDTAALGFLGLWSRGLGGSVIYVHGDTCVTFFSQEYVNGSDAAFAAGDLTLYGFVQGLASGITGEEAEDGDIFLADAPDVATPQVFELRTSDLTLYHDVNGDGTSYTVVGLAPGEEPDSGPYTWGMSSGPLVTDTTGLVQIWDVWNADEFYTYETGHNEWNRFTGILDSTGTFVDFERPIQFTYIHSTANDRNGDATYDGVTYFLGYNGPGELHGFPYEGVDLNGDLEEDRYYPVFSLEDAVVMGPTGVEYVIKAIEIEQVLNEDPGYMGTLDLTGAAGLTLPDGSGFTAPDIGPRPDVPEPPRVIEGDVLGMGT